MTIYASPENCSLFIQKCNKGIWQANLTSAGQKNCTKTIQNVHTKKILNTKFAYILYTKIVQIQILYNNECTKNIHQIPTCIQKMYKTCTKFILKTA